MQRPYLLTRTKISQSMGENIWKLLLEVMHAEFRMSKALSMIGIYSLNSYQP